MNITLNGTLTNGLKIEILDLAGKNIIKETLVNNGMIDISNVPSGICMLKATDENGVLVGLEKLVKK